MASELVAVLSVIAAILNSGIIQGVIQAIEQIYKGSTGADKKKVALAMVGPLVPIIGLPLISDAIDAQVAVFNGEGVFHHKAGPGDGNGNIKGPVTVIKGPRG